MRESAEVGGLGTSVLGEVENCLCDQDPRKYFLRIYTQLPIAEIFQRLALVRVVG